MSRSKWPNSFGTGAKQNWKKLSKVQPLLVRVPIDAGSNTISQTSLRLNQQFQIKGSVVNLFNPAVETQAIHNKSVGK